MFEQDTTLPGTGALSRGRNGAGEGSAAPGTFSPVDRSRNPFRVARLKLLGALRALSYRGRAPRLLALVGNRLGERWRLGAPPEGMHRLDVGSGFHPRPGYVHVDSDPSADHLEFLVSGHRLPLPDWWADEVNATHMLEHVPPPQIGAFLGEWFRVLRPGGLLEIHVPNAATLAEVLLREDSVETAWAVQNAIFGYWAHPADVSGPDALDRQPDHKILFTFGMLEQMLARSGFTDVREIVGENPCHHLVDWAPVIPGMCLEVRAARRLED